MRASVLLQRKHSRIASGPVCLAILLLAACYAPDTNGKPELSLAALGAVAAGVASLAPLHFYNLDSDGADTLGGPTLNLLPGWAPAADRHGLAGGAVQLNGQSINYSGLAFARNETQFFSAAIWIRPTGFSANEIGGVLLASTACTIGSPGWGLEFRRDFMAASRLRLYSSDGAAPIHDVSTGYSYPLNSWLHVAAVHAAGSGGQTCMRIYVNGALAAQQCLAPAAWLFATRFDIACAILPPDRYLLGDFDQFAFFDRALSDAEVQQLYLAP
ncbi:MAG: LamG domain-containing protein [Leptospirales bacterium]|nr:LamG domain-containing protein [Leptospirales bacterium]